jgi:ornithine cyclodeaminase/alanine dehydrogenase-like protein (mu-crystallin family)/DNA-binding response OmpR family regulator
VNIVTERPVSMLRRPGSRMLIIDDEEHITAAVTEYFMTLGYQVDCAQDAAAAHALLDRFDYAVIITDLRLSRSDRFEGFEILERIRSRCPQTASIVLTAHGYSENEKRARQRGASAFLQKPQPLEELAAVVAALVKQRTEPTDPIEQARPRQIESSPVAEGSRDHLSFGDYSAIPLRDDWTFACRHGQDIGRAVSEALILNAFREGEIVDRQQVEELMRWRLLDFINEPDSSERSDRPFVTVCGCGRSGTTLARVILDSHPKLYAGPESLLLLPVSIDTAGLARKFDLPRASLDAELAAAGGRVPFVERFQELVLRHGGKRVWVDKTARNVHRLGYIRRHFPQAKVIHVVRDPRDVVASLKTHRKHKVVGGRIVPTGYCMPISLCIDRLEHAIADALAHEPDPLMLTVRYEDLVLDTERTVRRLCDFIGVDFAPAMLEFHKIDSPTRDPRHFPQNIEATRPISPSSIGRHRMALTADEIAQTETRLGETMRRFGYEPGPVAPRGAQDLPTAAPTEPPRLVLEAEVRDFLARDPLQVKRWTGEALQVHHARRCIQPPKTYLRTSANPYDRIIALPAAVLGEEPALGIKWIGSHSRNVEHGRARAQALIVLNDPVTHAARVVMDGTLVSSMRTFAVTLLALDQFAPRPWRVAVLGMGRLGRMHATQLGELYPSIEKIACFSRRAVFDDLLGNRRIQRCTSADEALAEAEVIVTSSAAIEPYIFERSLSPDCRLIVNLSLMDCAAEVIAQSDHIVVDDLEQNLKADRVFKQGFDAGLYGRDRVRELGEVLFGPRRAYPGRVFVNPLGMGLEDVYVAGRIARGLGYYP